MKRTEAKKALKGKSAAELSTELVALYKEVRRGIARVKTLIGQKAGQA